jgi:hypothetical protein
LTTNLVYLVLPVANVSVERAVGDSSGLSGRFGIGRVSIDLPFGDDDTNTVVEIGGEYRYYLLGGFRSGLVIGGDVRYTNAGSGALLNVENAVAVGPVLGYKHAFGLGLTIDVRLGAQIAFGEADAVIVPLVSAGLGWSF